MVAGNLKNHTSCRRLGRGGGVIGQSGTFRRGRKGIPDWIRKTTNGGEESSYYNCWSSEEEENHPQEKKKGRARGSANRKQGFS